MQDSSFIEARTKLAMEGEFLNNGLEVGMNDLIS